MIFESIAERPDRLNLLRTFAHYLLTILKKTEHEKVTSIARQIFDSEGERIMSTIADELRESGRKEGVEEGLEEAIRTVLRARFGAEADSLLALVPALRDDAHRNKFLLLISTADSAEPLFEFLNSES